MLQSTISKVMTNGRKIFPIQNFGIGRLMESGGRILLQQNQNIPQKCNIKFIPEQQLTVKEGETYKAWLIHDATKWLYKEFDKLEFNPVLIAVSTPVLQQTIAVGVEGNVLSLTPGEQECINYGRVNEIIPNPIFSFGFAKLKEVENDLDYITDKDFNIRSYTPIACLEEEDLYLTFLTYYLNNSDLRIPSQIISLPLITTPIEFYIMPHSLSLTFSTVAMKNGLPYYKCTLPLFLDPTNPAKSVDSLSANLKNLVHKTSSIIGFYRINPLLGSITVLYNDFDNPPSFGNIDLQKLARINMNQALKYYLKIAEMIRFQ